jgi:alkaline phosphatase
MKTSRSLLLASLAALLTTSFIAAGVSRAGTARNIIFMVPDGMGLADVTAARIFKNGPNGAPLSFETLRHIGYQRTHSADSTVTDSAAAASAWACGEKFNNHEICFHRDGRPHRPSILELAKKTGKAAGLVTTSAITDATPAAFGAHVPFRGCGQEIARQYLMVSGIDVLLGGGIAQFTSEKADKCGTKGNYIQTARDRGYAVVYGRGEMSDAADAGSPKILGLFSQAKMTPNHLRALDTGEPRLAEMTAAALKVLERDRDGFFLLVEGSQVDWANHDNDLPYQTSEVLAFDEAVEMVRRWIKADPSRGENTLLIVVADHETGGFAVKGPKSGLLTPGTRVEGAWTGDNHTAVDTIIWSEGPGSEGLAKALDNTDVYDVLVRAMK